MSAMTPTAETRLDRWLSRPVASFLALGVGILLALPSVGSGFFADDDALLAVLDKRLAFNPPWYDLYRFATGRPSDTLALIARGEFPWWTAPEFRIHLVRPLSSALFAFDHAVFGLWSLGYHLHSIAWWALLLVALRALYRRILPVPAATLGLLLFAVAGAHFHPYAWISARHCLVAGAPAIVALLAAIRAREEAWAPGRWLAPLTMAVGLAGGEMALGGLAFWGAYEVFGPARPSTWGRRIARTAVPVGLGLAYLVFYVAAQGGAHDSGGYVDPSTPQAFALATVTRFPPLLATALVGVPAELAMILPGAARFAFVAAGGSIVAALLWRGCAPFLADAERAAARWLVPGALLSMLGAVGGFPGSRQLLLANLAWAPLFAILLRYGFRAGTASAPRLFLRRVGTSAEALLHLVAPPLMVFGLTANQAQVARDVRDLAHAPAYADGPANRTVFVVQASDPMSFLYPLALRAREGMTDSRACFSLLSGAKEDVRVTRTGPASFTVEARSGSFLRAPFETLYRAPSLGFQVGDEVTACGARVRILALEGAAGTSSATDAGGNREETDGSVRRPTQIEVTLTAGVLDDPKLRLVAWDAHTLRTLHLAIGERADIPWSAGPMGSF